MTSYRRYRATIDVLTQFRRSEKGWGCRTITLKSGGRPTRREAKEQLGDIVAEVIRDEHGRFALWSPETPLPEESVISVDLTSIATEEVSA